MYAVTCPRLFLVLISALYCRAEEHDAEDACPQAWKSFGPDGDGSSGDRRVKTTCMLQRSSVAHALDSSGGIAGNAAHGTTTGFCRNCCYSGEDRVACLDVDECAAGGPSRGRYAIVLTQVGAPHESFLPHIGAMRAQTEPRGIDIVLIIPREDAKTLSEAHQRLLNETRVRIVEVEWKTPPGMLFQPGPYWCGPQDLVRTHVLALEEYDAVAYFDSDIELQGDVTPVLRCAATGRFLTTSGSAPTAEPMSIGFFAARPDRRLRDAAVSFAHEANFSYTTGWGNSGFAPAAGSHYPGFECGQGFFQAFFYKRASSALVGKAWRAAGLDPEDNKTSAAQVDRCIWNYQLSSGCENLDCALVRAHHKPPSPGSDPKECLKRGVRERWLLDLEHEREQERKKEEHASEAGAETKNKTTQGLPATFGFYFPIFNEVPAVLRVVRQARHFYPDSPIHLLQDGGKYDLSGICQLPTYNCTFEWVSAENSRWNPHSWFRRMRSAAKLLRTTYVIYLEPDVDIMRRHRSDPQDDAGGIYDSFNPELSHSTVAYVERRGRERDAAYRLRWRHFGLAGGSYFRTEALLDAFDPVNVARIDFAGLQKNNPEVFSSDIMMHIALSVRGWVVYPWKEVAQNFVGTDYCPEDFGPACNPEAAFQHNHKEHYGDPLPKKEQSLLREIPQTEDVTCHGCVWYSGPFLTARRTVPSSPEEVANVADRCST